MKYELVYTPRAIRDINKLDSAIKRRIGETLLRYKENPLHYAEKLTTSELGADGWELVCIDGMHCVFKRPRE